MAELLRVVHYLNQFFGGMGGEERANLPLQVKEGVVGPGRALQQILDNQGIVVSTIICGDNYFNEDRPQATAAVKEALGQYKPDVVVAGPAFNAGRYGLACGEVCKVAQEMGIPAITAMYHENAGVVQYGKQIYIVPTDENPATMQSVLQSMVRLAVKLGRREELGPAEVEGYMPRGIRRPGFREKPAAVRAADMLMARLTGRPFNTEVPIQMPELVTPAPPIQDLEHATLALITTGGLVPKGNPDRLVRGGAKEFLRYNIENLAELTGDQWESVHRGFYTNIVNQNPNYILPLPVMRELEQQRVFKRLYPWFLTTSGVGTAVADAENIGTGMAEELKKAGVVGCILVAT